MSAGYDYHIEREEIFKEENQATFLNIRDNANALLKTAGAFNLQSVISDCTGSTWTMIACVDRLVELGEIREITPKNTIGQYRVFVRKNE